MKNTGRRIFGPALVALALTACAPYPCDRPSPASICWGLYGGAV